MSQILVTGIVTLDIIHFLSQYPEEDSEQRANQQLFETGGNASNSSYILKQLGHEPKLAATLADDTAADFIRQQLQQRQIDYFDEWRMPNSHSPTSCISINQQNASRTISHYRCLAELSFAQFDCVDLNKFDWLHFEGRNIQEQQFMLQKAANTSVPVSLEAEKDRPGIDDLFQYADVLFFSKTFARQRGFYQAEDCLDHFSRQYTDKLLICAWGEQGAWAWQGQQVFHSPAYPPPQLIDTRAAGDTFNAACINGLLKQQSTQKILQDACKLAGHKCGLTGLNLNLC